MTATGDRDHNPKKRSQPFALQHGAFLPSDLPARLMFWRC
jgi:hypothetical protein